MTTQRPSTVLPLTLCLVKYAPISGKVTEVNEALSSQPGLLNRSPEGDGTLLRLPRVFINN